MIAMSDLFRVSLRQVVRQRGFGVILSIALGITAFIVLAVLGREIRYKVGQDMVLMGGVNVIQVFMDDGAYPGQPQREFYPETIKALRALPGVGMVSLNLHGGKVFGLRTSGERTINMDFIGIDQYFAEVYSLTLLAGRLFDASDIERRRRVAMLGREAAQMLYDKPDDAVGKLLIIYGIVFMALGLPLLAGQNSALLLLSILGVVAETIGAMAVYILVIQNKYEKK